MAKPTGLTRKEWSDSKAVTLKSTKLGETLGTWETAWAACTAVGTRNYASYKKAITALNLVKTKVEEAKKACNKTLHKSTIEFLDAYPALITRAENLLKNHKLAYDDFVKNWKDVRVRAKAFMVKSEQEMDALISKADATVKHCEKAVTPDVKALGIKMAKAVIVELQTKQKNINETLADAREPKDRNVSPHPDDFPGDATNLFDECRQIQVNMTGKRANAEGDLQTAITKLGG
jgi:hypothetical protein